MLSPILKNDHQVGFPPCPLKFWLVTPLAVACYYYDHCDAGLRSNWFHPWIKARMCFRIVEIPGENWIWGWVGGSLVKENLQATLGHRFFFWLPLGLTELFWVVIGVGYTVGPNQDLRAHMWCDVLCMSFGHRKQEKNCFWKISIFGECSPSGKILATSLSPPI